MLYSWSAENDLLTLQSDFAGTANDVSFTNTFSPAHQWTSATASNIVFRYGPTSTSSYAYTANNVNEYSNFFGVNLAYDARGNYIGAASSPSIVYDAENRLMTISTNRRYTYDPMGRRTSKTYNGVTTNYLHDGDSEIAEYDGSGNLLRRFVPGPAIDDHIAMVAADGTKTFFHTDKMGSVIAMSDMSGNMVEGPYLYDAYGNCRDNNGTCGAGVPFRYTGQRWDSESGLYYYRARYYQPVWGRFLQTDPIGYKDDLNLYTYVHNDPTDGTNPQGLCDGEASHIGTATGSVCGGSDKDSTLSGSTANKAAKAQAARSAAIYNSLPPEQRARWDAARKEAYHKMPYGRGSKGYAAIIYHAGDDYKVSDIIAEKCGIQGCDAPFTYDANHGGPIMTAPGFYGVDGSYQIMEIAHTHEDRGGSGFSNFSGIDWHNAKNWGVIYSMRFKDQLHLFDPSRVSGAKGNYGEDLPVRGDVICEGPGCFQ